MKNQALHLLTGLCLVALALQLFTGCASVQPLSATTQARITTGLKLAASIGGTEILMEHPDWRQQFIEASQDLSYIENASGQVGIAQVIAIVQRLPIKELHSPRAVLYAQTGVLLLNEVGVETELPLEASRDVKAVAGALRVGIDMALAATAP